MISQRSNWFTSCLIYFLFFLLLSFLVILPLKAQELIPGLNLSPYEYNAIAKIPTFKEANLQLAPVFIDGKVVGFVSSKIALEPNAPDASTRAEIIRRKLQGILEHMSRYSKIYQSQQGEISSDELAKIIDQELKITVSQSQNTFVILIAFPQQAPPETVFSVTKADAQRAGLPELEFAQASVEYGRQLLLGAWKERQSDYLWSQAQFSVQIILALIIVSIIIIWLQQYLYKQGVKLRHLLADSTESSLPNSENKQPELEMLSHPLKLVVGIITARVEKLSYSQQHNLNAFFRAILWGMQILLWVIGFGYICSLFYWSRPLSNWLLGVTGWDGLAPLDWLIHWGQKVTLGVPLIMLLLILAVRLINKGSYILIDCMFRSWMEDKTASQSASSQRYQVRGPTLASAFKGLVTLLTYFLLGIFILRQIGALPNTVTVILGVIGLGISFGAQHFIKDIINGCLILWQDWYAVGDWIAIDELEGSVENLSLHMTQLRNLDGELITIPNGTISRVRNMSSGWSQVKFTISVSYDADVDQVMSVMEQVAQKLYEDSSWQEKLLGSPRMLGVERLDSTGVTISLVLKTKPLEQWNIAREYRRRLKEAFDRSKINIGIPRQLIIVNENREQGE